MGRGHRRHLLSGMQPRSARWLDWSPWLGGPRSSRGVLVAEVRSAAGSSPLRSHLFLSAFPSRAASRPCPVMRHCPSARMRTLGPHTSSSPLVGCHAILPPGHAELHPPSRRGLAMLVGSPLEGAIERRKNSPRSGRRATCCFFRHPAHRENAYRQLYRCHQRVGRTPSDLSKYILHRRSARPHHPRSYIP